MNRGAGRTKWLQSVKLKDVALEVAKNAAMTIPLVRRLRAKRGRTAGVLDVDRYALRPFRVLLDAVGVDGLRGKTVLEIGPGDHLPLGMLILGARAKQYVALDRFAGDVRGSLAKEFYAAVAAAAPDSITSEWVRRGLDPKKYPWPECIAHLAAPLEVGADVSADVIFSFAVLEHLSSVPAAFASMRRMLKPGGIMVHWVDYGPHDVWRSYSDPLAWLMIPDSLWRAMGSCRGTPNRLRHGDLVAAAEAAGFRCSSTIGRQFPEDALRAIGASPERQAAVAEATLICR